MKTVKILHKDDAIELHELKNDLCLVELGDQKVVFNYDTAFELALKLSTFLRDIEQNQDVDACYGERLN